MPLWISEIIDFRIILWDRDYCVFSVFPFMTISLLYSEFGGLGEGMALITCGFKSQVLKSRGPAF